MFFFLDNPVQSDVHHNKKECICRYFCFTLRLGEKISLAEYKNAKSPSWQNLVLCVWIWNALFVMQEWDSEIERHLLLSHPWTHVISIFLFFYHSISLSFPSRSRSRSHPLSCHFRDRAISSPGVDRAISLSTRSLNSQQHYHSAARQFISWYAIKKKAGAIKLDNEVLNLAVLKCRRITLTSLFFATGNWLTGDGSVRSGPGLARPVCQPQSLCFSFDMEARGLLSLSEHPPSPPQPRSGPPPKISSIQPHESSTIHTHRHGDFRAWQKVCALARTAYKSVSERSSVYCLLFVCSSFKRIVRIQAGEGFLRGDGPSRLHFSFLLCLHPSLYLSSIKTPDFPPHHPLCFYLLSNFASPLTYFFLFRLIQLHFHSSTSLPLLFFSLFIPFSLSSSSLFPSAVRPFIILIKSSSWTSSYL